MTRAPRHRHNESATDAALDLQPPRATTALTQVIDGTTTDTTDKRITAKITEPANESHNPPVQLGPSEDKSNTAPQDRMLGARTRSHIPTHSFTPIRASAHVCTRPFLTHQWAFSSLGRPHRSFTTIMTATSSFAFEIHPTRNTASTPVIQARTDTRKAPTFPVIPSIAVLDVWCMPPCSHGGESHDNSTRSSGGDWAVVS